MTLLEDDRHLATASRVSPVRGGYITRSGKVAPAKVGPRTIKTVGGPVEPSTAEGVSPSAVRLQEEILDAAGVSAVASMPARNLERIVSTLLDGRHRSSAERSRWVQALQERAEPSWFRVALVRASLDCASSDVSAARMAADAALYDPEWEVREVLAEQVWKLGAESESYLEVLVNDSDVSVATAARASRDDGPT